MSQQAEINKRSWIITALMVLLEKKLYGKITMGDIAKKAGVARQTVYLLFKNKEDIISRFLTETADTGLLSIERKTENQKADVICIKFNNEYISKHFGVFKKILTDTHLLDLIIRLTREKIFNIIECYRDSLTPQEYEICRCKLAYQAVGCLTIIADWLRSDMPQPIGDLVDMLNEIARPMKKNWRNLPNIEICIW